MKDAFKTALNNISIALEDKRTFKNKAGFDVVYNHLSTLFELAEEEYIEHGEDILKPNKEYQYGPILVKENEDKWFEGTITPLGIIVLHGVIDGAVIGGIVSIGKEEKEYCYNLMDLERFLEGVNNGVYTEYDGFVNSIYINGYKCTNFILEDFCYDSNDKAVAFDYNDLLELNKRYNVKVDWVNK